jgi:hypothetical protein
LVPRSGRPPLVGGSICVGAWMAATPEPTVAANQRGKAGKYLARAAAVGS